MKKLKLVLFIFLTFNLFFIKIVAASDTEDLNIMVIEINPLLKSITDNEFENNGHHPKVSEYFSQDLDASLNEVIKDLEETSHNYLKIKIVDYEYLDEFPTYKEDIKLSNGNYARRLDEETYLEKAEHTGGTHGDWNNLLKNNIFNEIPSYSFDYEYIVNKYNLVEKRKNNEFDQVWLLTIDPSQTYETIMVGNNPFWINAPGYILDCPNFMIANFSISRRDANLHALAHGVEGIMNAVFNKKYELYPAYKEGTYKYYLPGYSSYEKDAINIDKTNYNNLNLWEKFTLGTYSNSNAQNFSSVGNVHFPFNGTRDYDYTNEEKVYTNWKEWLNYPNINGNFELDNNSAWLNNAGNDKLDDSQNKDPDRLYTRFWFYLMPHIEGYTKEGYYNNWWKYFKTLDFVTEIEPVTNREITINANEEIQIKYKLKYNSGKTITKNIEPQYNNFSITGNNLQISGDKIISTQEGISNITIYHDNKSISYTINVKKEDNTNQQEDEKNNDDDKEKNPNTGASIPIILIFFGSMLLVIYYIISKNYKKITKI